MAAWEYNFMGFSLSCKTRIRIGIFFGFLLRNVELTRNQNYYVSLWVWSDKVWDVYRNEKTK